MVVAIILNAMSLTFIMFPLFSASRSIVTAYTDHHITILLTNHVIGLVAFVLSPFLVRRFAFGRFIPKRCMGIWLMRTTAITWGFSLVLGLSLYGSGYLPGRLGDREEDK
ncbi:MAG: hypothetical protein LUQ14_02075 [Methanomassiliicoccales archaeon]|nr:hypothetical protein [Methanomassiliicoccales archaeon]